LHACCCINLSIRKGHARPLLRINRNIAAIVVPAAFYAHAFAIVCGSGIGRIKSTERVFCAQITPAGYKAAYKIVLAGPAGFTAMAK